MFSAFNVSKTAPNIRKTTFGQTNAVVVGGGFGGIASALRLRALGYEVTLIDRMERLGGRAQVFERDGFTYDAGPTVITAPFLFEELFALFDENLHDHVTLKPLDPWYRIVFSDRKSFDYGGTDEDTPGGQRD